VLSLTPERGCAGPPPGSAFEPPRDAILQPDGTLGAWLPSARGGAPGVRHGSRRDARYFDPKHSLRNSRLEIGRFKCLVQDVSMFAIARIAFILNQ